MILNVIFFAQHVWSHIFHCSNVQRFTFSLFALFITCDCLISYSNDCLCSIHYSQFHINKFLLGLQQPSPGWTFNVAATTRFFTYKKPRKLKAIRKTDSEKFSRVRLIIFANGLTNPKTGSWFLQILVLEFYWSWCWKRSFKKLFCRKMW